jgi:hypothetical protein
MGYVVFAQLPEHVIDLAGIVHSARRFFEASVEVVSASGITEAEPRPTTATLVLTSAHRGYSGSFRVTAREASGSDLALAHEAEIRGRAAGMATLAERCPTIWVVEAAGEQSAPAALNLCALLASVALGPVMPSDASTLFGVRGAMERLEKLLGGSTLSR